MGTPHDQLLEKISRLPPERVAEVEDFVDFIAQRDTDRELVRASARASEAAFGKAGGRFGRLGCRMVRPRTAAGGPLASRRGTICTGPRENGYRAPTAVPRDRPVTGVLLKRLAPARHACF